jgi:cytochrome c
MVKRLLLAVLMLCSGLAEAANVTAGNAAAGKSGFNKCASCHQVGPAARSGFGPQLTAIIGRPAAAAKDYAYSEAMKKSGIVWSDKTLAAFLKSPNDVVPGTKMRFWGISDEQQIADLLAYLRSVQ